MKFWKNWLALAALAVVGSASAAWPEKPITLIVPFPAGGLTDAVSRSLAEEVGRLLGQPLIVDSRPGANGRIGLEQLARAPKDGYTIAVTVPGLMIFQPLTEKTYKFDPLRDFEPITIAVDTYNVFVAHPSISPAGDLREFVAKAKAQPGVMNYGTPGSGSSFHFNSVVLADKLGIKAAHVSYRGEAPALIDLAGGSIQFMLAGQSARPYIQDGKIKPIAVTARQRVAILPNVPTFAELGVDFRTDGWVGYVAPAGVPKEVLDRLSEAFRTAIKLPKVREQIATMGYEPVGNSREEFRSLIKDRLEHYRGLIQSGKVKLEE
ncbi:tripartite tricarboxylate transporter substrate binding protein [Hydrogenophaga sp.]|uniref:Bug family tripartite tricarboxylate transporter substrate binding protein n=1 Tax=Hydrogenophaga sp. TaxID=1904254 RepID=UPI002721FC9D|nr:tripartite tricarboxylate transporter substrate binding protein [Hydrogenophaga sp.]MDO9436405.1 tripartite tricarboxylate transporter substrate binding protein [Hydrogenophaga sp.]